MPTFVDLFGDPEVMAFGDGLRSPDWVENWIIRQDRMLRLMDLGALAIEEQASGAVLGYCGLSFDAKRCQKGELEIGFKLTKPSWGQGFATEAASAICKSRSNRTIIAIIDPENARSLRIASKLGMQFVREFMPGHYDQPDLVFARL